jgi:hypothetical protein
MPSSVTYGGTNPSTNLFTNSRFGVCSGSTCVAVGNNIVSNGTFDNVEGWLGSNCTLASVAGGQSGNCLQITRVEGNAQVANLPVTCEIGKVYQVTCYVKSGTSGNEVAGIYIFDASSDYYVPMRSATTGSWVQMVGYFTGKTVQMYVNLAKVSATAGTMLFDTLEIKEYSVEYVGADNLGPDTWRKSTTLDVRRLAGTNITGVTSQYSLLLTPSAAYDALWWDPLNNYNDEEYYGQFLGQTITMGAWVKTSAASHAYLFIADSDGNTFSTAHTGGGGWEWLEVTRTVSTSITYLQTAFYCDKASGAITVCKPMLVFGSSIGVGRWQPMPNEQIPFIYPQPSLLFGSETGVALSTASGVQFDAMSDSYGVVPKGIRQVLISCDVRDSASAANVCNIKFYRNGQAATVWQAVFGCAGIANDMWRTGNPQWVDTRKIGLMYDATASGTETLDVANFRYYGVRY